MFLGVERRSAREEFVSEGGLHPALPGPARAVQQQRVTALSCPQHGTVEPVVGRALRLIAECAAAQTAIAFDGVELAREMDAQGVKGEIVVSEAASLDDVSTAVLKAAADFNADLLVMGTHGRRGFQRLILGSVAERCVRQASLPVLLIPSAAGKSGDAD